MLVGPVTQSYGDMQLMSCQSATNKVSTGGRGVKCSAHVYNVYCDIVADECVVRGGGRHFDVKYRCCQTPGNVTVVKISRKK